MIVVLAGGPSSERQVSLWTAKTITDSLKRQNIAYHLLDPDEPNWIDTLESLRPEAVVIALHGPFGEDGQVQHILEDLQIPFTGSDSAAAEISIDKHKTKQIISTMGIATPKWVIADINNIPDFPVPAVVKPNKEGSSFGVTLVWSVHEIEPAAKVAANYDKAVMIEQYIAGTEVTCGVIDIFGETQALPLVEIRPHTQFFDFEAKYKADQCDEICPAEIDVDLTKSIQEQSVAIFQKMDLRQYSRFDWIIKDDRPYFLEVNTLPGMTATSLINKELAAAKIDFDKFIRQLIETTPKISHNNMRRYTK